MGQREKKNSFGEIAVSAAAALSLAAYIYMHLGDYTAERGWTALIQVFGISAAFGAMVFLILATTLNAIGRIFPDDRP